MLQAASMSVISHTGDDGRIWPARGDDDGNGVDHEDNSSFYLLFAVYQVTMYLLSSPEGRLDQRQSS